MLLFCDIAPRPIESRETSAQRGLGWNNKTR